MNFLFTFAPLKADVAELVDALDLGSSAYGVGVRVPSSAQTDRQPTFIGEGWRF